MDQFSISKQDCWKRVGTSKNRISGSECLAVFVCIPDYIFDAQAEDTTCDHPYTLPGWVHLTCTRLDDVTGISVVR